LKSLLKTVYKLFLPKRLLPHIDLFSSIRKLNNYQNTLNEKNILIVAPHMDDEIIACGGVMHKYAQQGANVSVIFMTDGKEGNSNYDPLELINLRREESRKACHSLGVRDLVFLDNPEKYLKNSEENQKVIKNLVEVKNIEAIYYPMAFDGNRDHVATSWIVLDALKKLNTCIKLYGYCVWSPIIPTLTVNIDKEIDQKVKAMALFTTQLEQFDLIDMTLSNSRYMSYVYGMWKGYSENFIVGTVKEHLRLVALLR
tara:strand:+ start:8518 stop:9285 length:768 start_codon:yes stop_codon:yes gene_type:complete